MRVREIQAKYRKIVESRWSGDAENAFFSSEQIDKHRVLLQPEFEASARGKNSYYVLGIDVGRKGCQTEVVILKVAPQAQGSYLKSLVNLYTFDEEHFETQAINIKKLYYKYKARGVSIDGNGLGIGLVDYMVKSQVDPETGETLPPFGVSNDVDGAYKQFRTPDMEQDAMFIVKANAPINTEIYSYMQMNISSGKLKLLIDSTQAKVKLMSTKIGQQMDNDQRAERLRPFVLTDILKEQLCNLVEENEGVNIILKQSTKKIPKDKFSALAYGLYYVKQEEDRKKKRKGVGLGKLMFFS